MGDDARMVQFLFHMTPAGKQWLESAAKIRGESQAACIRAMFSFASRYMPTRWTPDDDPIDEPGTEPDRSLTAPVADPAALLQAGRSQRADRRRKP